MFNSKKIIYQEIEIIQEYLDQLNLKEWLELIIKLISFVSPIQKVYLTLLMSHWTGVRFNKSVF